ncbi:MurR/RpiR family transcriptional regulator [Ferdinandcohnia quinoae]|uniref:MurR/RpiR family transcriptional regulator n=1 Tax=Fredinandcohnia quinoae TaxID=2918902 RepID=A0AAW5DV41_9BACI|nr:MurR/RpiR family transcriptional regulator [Fredinandcohnia sp. SECRCQ15]MCH1624512.1 MurR/RpiR family transcriptional regulator [Fredinandcohnia sp. SECRCQ15]
MSRTEKVNPLLMIQSVYNSLTKTEQKVADYIIVHHAEAVYSSVTDLAEMVGVGDTTVIRFCRKLGYRGFQDFKLAVAQNLMENDEHVYGKIDEGDSLEIVSKKIANQNISALNDTLALLKEQTLQIAIEKINGAKKIFFFGVGSSGFTALDGQHRLMRLGYNAEHVSDSHIMSMTSSLLGAGDVIIAISSSGSTKDVVDAIKIAKKNNAYIICITNQARSPITKYADLILLAANKESPFEGSIFSSKIAQLLLLDVLATNAALQKKEQSSKAIKNTAESVLDKLY